MHRMPILLEAARLGLLFAQLSENLRGVIESSPDPMRVLEELAAMALKEDR